MQEESVGPSLAREAAMKANDELAGVKGSTSVETAREVAIQVDRDDVCLPAQTQTTTQTTTQSEESTGKIARQQHQLQAGASKPTAAPAPVCGGAKRTHKRPFFNPSDAFCHWWSGVVSLAFLYNFWSLSYRFAFKEIDDSTVTTWFLFDYAADFIYLNDIFVNFRTGYLEDGVLQRDPTKIGIHYRESTLFYLDMLCLLPFDFLYLSFSYCSILRCNKLVKIYKFWSFVDRTERHTNYPNVFRTFTLVHYILVIFHWNACLFHMISKHNVIDITTLYKINETQCDDILCQYLHAFYWSTLALTLVGDLPRPRTRGEYLYVIVELCFGLFLFASVLGHVANIVTNVSAARKEFQAKLDAVKTFMRTRRVSDDLQNKVIRWFDYLWYSQKSSDEERSVACLPDRLKAEIAIHVNLDTLKRVDIFQNTEAGFLCELVLRLKPVLFSPGDYVCRKNEVGHEMYIVSRGLLEVVTDDGQTVVATFRAGSYFGEIAVLNVGSAGNKRTASVRSVGYSDLFCLSKRDLWDVLKDYPNAEARIRAVAEERLSKLSAGLGATADKFKRKQQQQQQQPLSSAAAAMLSSCPSATPPIDRQFMRSANFPALAVSPAKLAPLGSGRSTARVCNPNSCYYKSPRTAAGHHRPPDLLHHGCTRLASDDYCCHCSCGAHDFRPDIWLAPATPRPSSSSKTRSLRQHKRDYVRSNSNNQPHALVAPPPSSTTGRNLYSSSTSNFHAHCSQRGVSDRNQYHLLGNSHSSDYAPGRLDLAGARTFARPPIGRPFDRGRHRAGPSGRAGLSATASQQAASSGGASGSSPSSTLSGTGDGDGAGTSQSVAHSAGHRASGARPARLEYRRCSSLTQMGELSQRAEEDEQQRAEDQTRDNSSCERDHFNSPEVNQTSGLASEPLALRQRRRLAQDERAERNLEAEFQHDLMISAIQTDMSRAFSSGRFQALSPSIDSLDFEPIERRARREPDGDTGGECRIDMMQK